MVIVTKPQGNIQKLNCLGEMQWRKTVDEKICEGVMFLMTFFCDVINLVMEKLWRRRKNSDEKICRIKKMWWKN